MSIDVCIFAQGSLKGLVLKSIVSFRFGKDTSISRIDSVRGWKKFAVRLYPGHTSRWIERQIQGFARTNTLYNVSNPTISPSPSQPLNSVSHLSVPVFRLGLSGIICRHQEQIISKTPAAGVLLNCRGV